MSPPQPILLVSGLGNGVGIGGACARLFSLDGYRIGLISRPRQDIEDLCQELKGKGGETKVFSVQIYDHENLERVFKEVRKEWPESRLKTAVWNTKRWSCFGWRRMKVLSFRMGREEESKVIEQYTHPCLSNNRSNIPFLDIKESDIRASTQINIISATAFAQHAVRMFLEAPSSKEKHDAVGGTLIITGATSATRGALGFGAFAAGKSGLRALSQSIAREFGPQGVHVTFVVVDGTIKTKATTRLFSNRHERSQDGKSWLDDETLALQPGSIARAYKYLNEQDPSAWTLEMDLRPAKEKF
ncbi:BQ2448_1426 [Microbotryum intermedium]|uniref:BQ2448_1426 protein n=1 Tax=Microbotryum intermedium TaxID=269621 RepID=A0A238F840_9BASI|nr:BQ2448_1426 [Microbotryum intermedium]